MVIQLQYIQHICKDYQQILTGLTFNQSTAILKFNIIEFNSVANLKCCYKIEFLSILRSFIKPNESEETIFVLISTVNISELFELVDRVNFPLKISRKQRNHTAILI